jgi:hypothetical protein
MSDWAVAARRVNTITWDGIRYLNAMQLEALLRDYIETMDEDRMDARAAVGAIADALGTVVSGEEET